MALTNATLNDVAREAGVSLITASRALSGTVPVSDKTKQKVMAAVKAVGYSPNFSAKVLKGGQTNVIGIVISNLRSPYITEVVNALSDAMERNGKDVIIYNTTTSNGAPARQNPSRFLNGVCDGLVLVLPGATAGPIEQFESSRIPLVLMNYWRTETTLPVVRGDNFNGAKLAVQHLIGLGHKKIAYINGSAYSGQNSERLRGYCDALATAGLQRDPSLELEGDFSRASGFRTVQQLLNDGKKPTAIFAANDLMAFGAMDALSAAGLRVPKDISVVGFDDVSAAAEVFPRLTTVRQPLDAMSEQAVRLLVKCMNKDVPPSHRIEFPSELVIRDSTGPAPLHSEVAVNE